MTLIAKFAVMGKETLGSIAQKAGCSVSTVSRVLGGNAGKYRISQKTIDRILKMAREADYTPSLLAKGLRMQKTYTLGLVLPSFENPFFAQIASILVRNAKEYGYQIIVADTQEDESNEDRNISALKARGVDGLIIMPCSSEPDKYQKLIAKGTPLVLVDRGFPSECGLSMVSTDNFAGAVIATEHLISAGHKAIVYLQGNPRMSPSKARKEGYIHAMTAHGLADRIQVCGNDFSIQNGYLETRMLLSRKERPTALFAGSNQILLGCMKAVKEAGLDIPGDLSIVTFDDNVMFDYLDPGITSIAQPVEEMSKLALKILIESIESDTIQPSPVNILIPPKMTARESVCWLRRHPGKE